MVSYRAVVIDNELIKCNMPMLLVVQWGRPTHCRRLPRCPADSAVLNKESRLSQGGHLSSGLYYVYVDVGDSNAAKVLEVRGGARMQNPVFAQHARSSHGLRSRRRGRHSVWRGILPPATYV